MLSLFLKKDNVIKTPRLVLRPWRESDAASLFKYASDPDVGPRAGWPVHKTQEDSLRVIREIFLCTHSWAMELRETGEVIGCIGYYPYGQSNILIGKDDAEVGYWLGKPYWNRGLCTEALQTISRWCFKKKKFLTLWGDYFEDNPASGRVLAKCGFRDTGELAWLHHVAQGIDRPVRIMRLDRPR